MPALTTPAKAFLAAFFVDSVLHLSAILFDLQTLRNITKPLLMLLLIGVVLSTVAYKSHPSIKLLIFGQIFSCFGDIALIGSGELWFGGGIAMFLVAQIFYIKGYFVLGAREGLQARPWVKFAYPAFWLVANLALAPGLGILAIPIAIYSAALVTMAMSAMSLGTVFGIGGTLFMFSDLLIGEGVAYGSFPGSDFLCMLTYILGQVIICLCWLKRVQSEPHVDATAARPVAASS